MQAHSTLQLDRLLQRIKDQQAKIADLSWNPELNMFNQAGLRDQIAHLPEGRYTVVLADINRLKRINEATGNHVQTNRYLRDGLRVRRGELAGQLYGDEILFVLDEDADADGFCTRIARQLAEQPLTQAERAALEAVDGPGARLSATYAWVVVEQSEIPAAFEALSCNVLAQKAARDRRIGQC